MIKLLSYSGLTTKIRAMEANLMNQDDYQKISNLETVTDFISFLKNHPGYHDTFVDLDEHTIHRGQAEDIIIHALYADFNKIYRFSNLEQRKDLNLIFFRYEVNIMKDCIQLVYSGIPNYDLSKFSNFFNNHSKINVKALAASHSMDEYINNLKGTQYYHLFVILQNANHLTPFDYEMQLDIYYFKKIWKLKDKYLASDNLKSITHSLGSEIDLLNIMWLYRSKKYYDIHSTDAYGYIIPVSYKLTRQQLTRLMEAITIDEFITILKTTYYKEFCTTLLDGSMEYTYQKIISGIYQTYNSNYPFSMAPVNYYFYQKLSEIRRLTTALECIRYKLEPQETLRYVLPKL